MLSLALQFSSVAASRCTDAIALVRSNGNVGGYAIVVVMVLRRILLVGHAIRIVTAPRTPFKAVVRAVVQIDNNMLSDLGSNLSFCNDGPHPPLVLLWPPMFSVHSLFGADDTGKRRW